MVDTTTHNSFCKCIVLLLALLGIVFSVFSMGSCRWFELESPELETSRWDFLPENAIPSQTQSLTLKVGLYRYEQQEFLDNGDRGVCTAYTRTLLWRGPERIYSWMFTSQLCVFLGPVISVMALVTLVCGKFLCHFSTRQKYFMACCLLLLAAGLQWASVIASLAWCSDCNWLSAATLNVVAALFLSMSWLLLAFFYKKEQTFDVENDKSEDKDSSSVRTNTDMASIHNSGEMEDVELGSPPQPLRKKHSLLARELLGTNDPIIFNAVAQGAMAIREFAQNKAAKEEASAERKESMVSVASTAVGEDDATAKHENTVKENDSRENSGKTFEPETDL